MATALSPTIRPSKPINAILFDVDGVLWDTRESYDRTIFETLEHLLDALNHKGSARQVTRDDLRTFRRAGNLNSDFDLTYVLMTALLCGYEDLSEAAADTQGKGIAWAHALRGHASQLEFDLVRRWFDWVYWGTEDFDALFGGKLPALPYQPGNWRLEKPFVSTSDLDKLLEKGVEALGIATGRSLLELQTVLTSSQLATYIPLDSMCTRDILSKPKPEVLEWCLQRMQRQGQNRDTLVSSLLYCGDTRDDLQLVLNYLTWEDRIPASDLWVGAVSVVDEVDFAFYLDSGAAACTDHIRYLPAIVEEFNQRVEFDE